ncbi:MAG: hypothetical protein ACRDTH_01245 [Pseudonocardiaceae bacterium]
MTSAVPSRVGWVAWKLSVRPALRVPELLAKPVAAAPAALPGIAVVEGLGRPV